MKTIAIDTSVSHGTVAACHGDRLAVRVLEPAGAHARLLAAAVVAVTSDLGWKPADADLVAVVRGPGSFTGLRVGVTTAKALAWANGCRLIGISGCEACARASAAALGGSGTAPVHVAYAAGRGEVFASTVSPDSRSPTGWTVGASGIAAASEWTTNLPAGAIVCGPGLAELTETLARRPDLRAAPPAASIPAAADIVAIALARAAAGEQNDPATLVPEYMRQHYADEAAGRSAI